MKRKHPRSKIGLYRAFYFSTLSISVPFAVVIGGLVAAMAETKAQKVSSFLLIYATVGLLAAFWYKETMRRNEYLYYNNGGCSRWGLWGVSFGISMLIWAVVSLCVRIWMS